MKRFVTFLLVLVLLAGVGVMLYPTVSDQYNKYQNARRIADYHRVTDTMDPEEYRAILDACEAYNRSVAGMPVQDAFGGEASPLENSDTYWSLLNPNGDGIMGIIEIPKIGVRIPIYHTTEDDGLEKGAGHMEGTSLPVGGESTHCALAGHRGLPSARLFTDLDMLAVGDMFYITALNETLVYQVDQILVVEPYEMDTLALVPGEDLVTLVTCTPYGVNTQRLLVRGRRARMEDISKLLATEDGVAELPLWQTALMLAVPLLVAGWLLLGILALFGLGRKRKL